MAKRWATCCTESLSALTLPCILLTMDRSLSIDFGVFGSVLASIEVTIISPRHGCLGTLARGCPSVSCFSDSWTPRTTHTTFADTTHSLTEWIEDSEDLTRPHPVKLAREYPMKLVMFALWDFGRMCWVMPRQHLRALSSDLLRDLRDEATAAQSNTAAQACQRDPDPIR